MRPWQTFLVEMTKALISWPLALVISVCLVLARLDLGALLMEREIRFRARGFEVVFGPPIRDIPAQRELAEERQPSVRVPKRQG
jgi:hypothetical protein